ncbi:hypothetical protein AVEN_45019-1 [Araneus ventricosus]|uniref:Uncharacterized protein n=1 Tax=Araneus ventricosus TaxID=182803 RepID=A0A4Y2I7G3_ARAVE|nr:hypothetical protein AVEN_45019-1 [Araneus ventricosus]
MPNEGGTPSSTALECASSPNKTRNLLDSESAPDYMMGLSRANIIRIATRGSDDEERHLIWHPSLSKLPHRTNGTTFGSAEFNVHQTRLHGGSSVEKGFVPGTLRPYEELTGTLRSKPYYQAKAAQNNIVGA